MLKSLTIENYALIESLHVEWNEHLNIITLLQNSLCKITSDKPRYARDKNPHKSVPLEYVSSINLLRNIIQARIVSICDDCVALRLERLKVIHHSTAEEC